MCYLRNSPVAYLPWQITFWLECIISVSPVLANGATTSEFSLWFLVYTEVPVTAVMHNGHAAMRSKVFENLALGIQVYMACSCIRTWKGARHENLLRRLGSPDRVV